MEDIQYSNFSKDNFPTPPDATKDKSNNPPATEKEYFGKK